MIYKTDMKLKELSHVHLNYRNKKYKIKKKQQQRLLCYQVFSLSFFYYYCNKKSATRDYLTLAAVEIYLN